MKHLIATYIFLFVFFLFAAAQSADYKSVKVRKLRYTPEGEDFVIINGKEKFNRALYGTNTAFRIETGDIPELGFFMPDMGGNMQFGLIKDTESIWLNNAEYIKSIYRAGCRIYEIKDPFIGNGTIIITVLATDDAEGMILRVKTSGLPPDTELVCMYGGADNRRFFRNGDLGVDEPDAFRLKPESCENNIFSITGQTVLLEYGKGTKNGPCFAGLIFSGHTELKTASPYNLSTPLYVWQSEAAENKPVIISRTTLENSGTSYIALIKGNEYYLTYSGLDECFERAEKRRKDIAETVKISTPDPFFNTLGGVLCIAADGIWGEPDCWQHGAVGWRMPLNGWRAAYAGDAIGWHKRARKHFDGYALSQITDIEPVISHPAQDKDLNLARAEKKWGTQMYSNGYICRTPYNTTQMHHYDMNLVYTDQLLWHFNRTGDMDYVRNMWPLLKRHLAWEKRNFDPDDDGLYDAYAAIWASDALQYNSGGVTYSSAYNYRANKMAAEIAEKTGEDPEPYRKEAEKILKAVNSQLWLADRGWWAEFKDFMGNRLIHPDAGLWSVYHAIDSDIHTPFQAYQATRYIDTKIPHIPVVAEGLDNEGYKIVSTSNLLPYSWSVNNVAFAEVAHTALAYWQTGRYDEAFKLFKSAVLDGMYIGRSPGNIGQISFYDAARGECYRDFGDPIGVYSEALVRGLFGILPDLMNNRVLVRPGFPSGWNFASLSTPDISLDFKKDGLTEAYTINTKFGKTHDTELSVKAERENIKSVTVNGRNSKWSLEEGIDNPQVKIRCSGSDKYEIKIEWSERLLHQPSYTNTGVNNELWSLKTQAKITEIYDPQNLLKNAKITDANVNGILNGTIGHRTLFIRLQQGQMSWWKPVNIEIKEPFSVIYDPENNKLQFKLKNNTLQNINATLKVNTGANTFTCPVTMKQGEVSPEISVPDENVKMGTNILSIENNDSIIFATRLINWNLTNKGAKYETINLENFFNASVTRIFKNEYLTPRSPYTTLQIPKQGIGEWCHPLLTAEIDDTGLRTKAKNGFIEIPSGLPFLTTERAGKNNIAFTSLWDNYPDRITIPLTGKASHAYLMMAGSTNHMQCHITNGTVTIKYKGGKESVLELIPPETWAPVEQDYYKDEYAFKIKQPRPYRVAFKTGIVSRDMEKDMNIDPEEVYGRSIDGGAGIILDIPLDSEKELESLKLKTIANEVVIGLMSVTLVK